LLRKKKSINSNTDKEKITKVEEKLSKSQVYYTTKVEEKL